jgi:hypothetical protein
LPRHPAVAYLLLVRCSSRIDMRNILILALLIVATFAAWIVATALLVSPFLHVGQSFPVYFGLVMLPDLASLLIYSVLAFIAAWLASRFFIGSAAGLFRGLALAALIVLFLWIRGAFIISNYRFTFFARELLFATVVAAVGLYAFYFSRRGDRHI